MSEPLSIVFALYPNLTQLDFTGPFEVLQRLPDTRIIVASREGGTLASAMLEPHEGGRWYERGVDGSECEWGRVLAYVPPARIAVSWHLNAQFQYDPDPAKASRVEVSFYVEEPTRTRVELVHSGLERHGEGWEKVRDSVGSPGGWIGILGNLANTADTSGG
jgi:hypothetical protein